MFCDRSCEILNIILFTLLEPCVFIEANQMLLQNNYIKQTDDNWLLTCLSTSEKFVSSCDQNGTWVNIKCKGKT